MSVLGNWDYHDFLDSIANIEFRDEAGAGQYLYLVVAWRIQELSKGGYRVLRVDRSTVARSVKKLESRLGFSRRQ